VTGIQAVANYTSLDDLQGDLDLTPIAPGTVPLQMAETVAILGHKFFVPNDPRWTYEELLREAVELSSERPFQRKRASFWRRQRSFFDDKEVITDTAAIADAVEEMEDLLEDERALVRKTDVCIRTCTRKMMPNLTAINFGVDRLACRGQNSDALASSSHGFMFR
jgi:hypothetical protein